MIEPLTVHGDGNYPLSSVKEIKVTDTFLGLEQRFKKCQTKESLGECTSALLLNKSIEMCGCVPFGLKTLTDGNQESFKLFFLFINTLNSSCKPQRCVDLKITSNRNNLEAHFLNILPRPG